jgi:hypothetical protein
MAPTMVPPDPADFLPAHTRQPQKTMIGSGLKAPIPGMVPAPAAASPEEPPAPADVDMSAPADVDMSTEEVPFVPPQNEAPVAAPETAAPASPAAGPEGSGPSAAGSVPDWAESSPSMGTATKSASQPGRNKLLIAGIAGGGLLVVAVVAGLLAGGKSTPKPETAKAVPAAESPKPAPSPVAAEPANAPAEAAKAPAVAEAKAAPAPEKAAVPAEKPAKPEAVVPAADKVKPEKKPAPEKLAMAERPAKPAPAPKPVSAPAAEKSKAWTEPVPVKAEKKAAEPAAPAGGNKVQMAAEAYQRGNAKLLSGALPEAIAAFSEAIKLNPKDAQSQRGLGLAYAQSGKAPLAVRHLKLYLKAAPGAPDRALIEKRVEQLSGR